MEIKYKYLKHIMKEMCRRVGADYDSIDFSEPNWYNKYEWTEQESDDFVDWLSKFFIKNKEARLDILDTESTNKKLIDEFCKMFAFNYGWRFKK